MRIAKNSIFKSLLALMIVFFLGFSALLGIHYLFKNIIDSLDGQIKNEYGRYQIGEYILHEINSIEKNYYMMSTLFKKESAMIMKEEILEEIEHIYLALDVLKSGGYIYKYIKLNMAEAIEAREKIEFYPRKNVTVSYENIDLKPKLFVLEDKLDDLVDMIDLKDKMLDSSLSTEEKRGIRIKIAIFLKQIPPQFLRMKENASRLLYQSKQNVLHLESNVAKEKKKYFQLELIVSLVVMVFVLVFGYFVTMQIQKKNRELEEMTERANDFAEEATKANQAKSQFLANMSHEIRTPLNAIIGFSDILATSSLGEKEKDKANIISKSAKALLNIINDILDLSKVESGKFEIINEKFNTRTLFEQIVELFSVSAKEKNIRFFYNADKGIPTYLIGDSTRIKQVLSNLISNAIKFTPQNSKVNFEIDIIKEDEQSISLKFIVEDRGIGISEENIKKIFEPFSQADGSISRKFGGTGLGLSISLQIVKMMDSEIHLTSKEGEGSTFFFEINFPKADDTVTLEKKLDYNFALCTLENDDEKLKKNLENYLSEMGHIYTANNVDTVKHIEFIFCFNIQEHLHKLKELKLRFDECKIIYVGDEALEDLNEHFDGIIDYKIDVPIYGSKIFNIIATKCQIEKKDYFASDLEIKHFEGNVLVAEDNLNNQELIKILLSKLGTTCDVADNGQIAVDMFKNGSYDLIFMDINMPVMDGLEAMKQIKSISPSAKVVALTANTLKGDKEHYLKEGMDDFLSKPIMMAELIALLQKYLNHQKSCELPEKQETKQIEETPNTLPVYDKEVAIKRLMLDESILDMLLDNFFLTLQSDLETLEKALQNMSYEEIYQIAHRIKGSCANLAMDDIAKTMLDLEQKAKNKEEIIFDFDGLKKDFEAIKSSL